MSLRIHEPPGRIFELTDDNLTKWSDRVSNAMREAKQSSEAIDPVSRFYDATQIPLENNIGSRHVPWSGFPTLLTALHPINQERWSSADSLRKNQTEYLEWSVRRNQDDIITKIVFTCEFPEYFDFLGQTEPETLLKLYRDLNPGEKIQEEDLFTEGVPFKEGEYSRIYNQLNKWNNSDQTGAIMHLIAPGSTMSALFDLIARATAIYKDENGSIITNGDHLASLINGDRNRNSDVVIGAAVNAFARDGDMITVENPVGIYIDGINLAQIDPPPSFSNVNVADFFKFTRGVSGLYTRLECEVPEGSGFVLGELNIAGERLQYGAQLADLISASVSIRMISSP